MKKLVIILLVWFPLNVQSQSDVLPGIESYFAAIIVNNIDSSISWYTDKLGLGVLNKYENEERGFRQANLKRGNILIELIELKSAVSLQKAIPDYDSKTRITGFFKIGFIVDDFEKWMDHFNDSNAEIYGDVVTDNLSGNKTVIIKDPDGNRIQIFEK